MRRNWEIERQYEPETSGSLLSLSVQKETQSTQTIVRQRSFFRLGGWRPEMWVKAKEQQGYLFSKREGTFKEGVHKVTHSSVRLHGKAHEGKDKKQQHSFHWAAVLLSENSKRMKILPAESVFFYSQFRFASRMTFCVPAGLVSSCQCNSMTYLSTNVAQN